MLRYRIKPRMRQTGPERKNNMVGSTGLQNAREEMSDSVQNPFSGVKSPIDMKSNPRAGVMRWIGTLRGHRRR